MTKKFIEHNINLNLDQSLDFAKKISDILEVQDVILLDGDLGSGKTTLVKNICYNLNNNSYISSPSFGLYHVYKFHNLSIWHYDFYRLKDDISEEKLINLDFDEALSNNITIIEWSKRLKNFKFNKHTLQINISYNQNDHENRIYNIKYLDGSKWSEMINSYIQNIR